MKKNCIQSQINNMACVYYLYSHKTFNGTHSTPAWQVIHMYIIMAIPRDFTPPFSDEPKPKTKIDSAFWGRRQNVRVEISPWHSSAKGGRVPCSTALMYGYTTVVDRWPMGIKNQIYPTFDLGWPWISACVLVFLIWWGKPDWMSSPLDENEEQTHSIGASGHAHERFTGSVKSKARCRSLLAAGGKINP